MRLIHVTLLTLALLHYSQVFADSLGSAPTFPAAPTKPTQPTQPLSNTEKSILGQISKITPSPFTVSVKDGVATVTGVASTEQAILIVAITLTTSNVVSGNFLITDKSGRPISEDAILAGKILAILVNQEIFPAVTQVAEIPISISAHNGIISLSGKVEDKEAIMLIATVLITDGVKDVATSELTQSTGDPLSNDTLTSAKVTAALYNTHMYGDIKSISQMPVTVYTNGGIVFLDGTVDSQPIMAQTINTARRVPGVQRVISRMYVRFAPVKITI